MNFLPMRYFIAVAQCKGISRAAKELYITQQTLSAHMSALEKELGCTLFMRKPRFELTYAGKRFLEYALSFCSEYDSMNREFSDIGGKENGIVRVGVAHTRSSTILPSIIEGFQKQYPYIQIASIEQTNSRILEALCAGERDVAIARFDNAAPELSVRTLYSEDVLIVVSKQLLDIESDDEVGTLSDKGTGHSSDKGTGHSSSNSELPIAEEEPSTSEGDDSPTTKGHIGISQPILDKLANIAFFMSSDEDITGRIGSAFLRKNNLNPPIKAYSDNAATLLALCVKGLGACFCPNKLLFATLSPQQLASVHVIPINERYDIQIAHRYDAYLPRAAMLFEEFCLNYFAKPTSSK